MGIGCSGVATTPHYRPDIITLEFPHKLLMIGPSGAGKTQLLYSWKVGCCDIIEPIKTVDFNVEQVESKDGPLLIFDLSGLESFRQRRRQFYGGTEGIVFVVDSANIPQLEEARQDLVSVIHDRDLLHLPLLIIANKQDLADALTADELEKLLGLENIKQKRIWKLIEICAKEDKDSNYALEVLVSLMKTELDHQNVDTSEAQETLRSEHENATSR